MIWRIALGLALIAVGGVLLGLALGWPLGAVVGLAVLALLEGRRLWWQVEQRRQR